MVDEDKDEEEEIDRSNDEFEDDARLFIPLYLLFNCWHDCY